MHKVIIGSDHAGFKLKEALKADLIDLGLQVEDAGCHSIARCDYPRIAYSLAQQVSKRKFSRGILICNSGIGNSIVANKLPGVSAALCHNLKTARLSREHNNSNVLVLGAAFVSRLLAKRMLRVWLKTEFMGGRHKRRINQIKRIILQTSRNIEIVNKILAIIQTEGIIDLVEIDAFELMNHTIQRLIPYAGLDAVEVQNTGLVNIKLNADMFLHDAVYELILFILNSYIREQDQEKVFLPINVDGKILASSYCITIREHYSPPMTQMLISQLTSQITDKWESRGHYLPIALTSVIMNHYGGKLIIESLMEKGNEFQLHFPPEMVSHSPFKEEE